MHTAQLTRRSHLEGWSWALSAQLIQLIVQALSLALFARVFPVNDLGLLVSLTAITSILAPFVGVGAPNLLIRDVGRDRTAFKQQWGNLVFSTLLSGPFFCLAAIAIAFAVLPRAVPAWEIGCVAVIELLLFRAVGLISLALQGLGMIDRMSQLTIVMACTRLLTVFLLLMLPAELRQIRTWLLLYSATGVLLAACVFWSAWRAFGKPSRSHLDMKRNFREGLWFVFSPLAQSLNNDADKVVLARFDGLSNVAFYGVAYKIVFAAFVPVQALLTVTYPQFFRQGREGIRQTAQYAARWLQPALGYSLLAGVLLFTAAPIAPRLLGPKYLETATALRFLAALPLLKTLQFLFADALTGADFQRLRVGLHVLIAILNLALNLAWVPRYGWHGAAWATLACDGAQAMLFMGATWRLHRNERRGILTAKAAAAKFND